MGLGAHRERSDADRIPVGESRCRSRKTCTRDFASKLTRIRARVDSRCRQPVPAAPTRHAQFPIRLPVRTDTARPGHAGTASIRRPTAPVWDGGVRGCGTPENDLPTAPIPLHRHGTRRPRMRYARNDLPTALIPLHRHRTRRPRMRYARNDLPTAPIPLHRHGTRRPWMPAAMQEHVRLSWAGNPPLLSRKKLPGSFSRPGRSMPEKTAMEPLKIPSRPI